MLVLAAVGTAVVVVIVVGIVNLVLVIAVTTSMFDADVANVRGSIGMVDWRKVRVGVRRRRRMCQRHSWTP